MKTEVKIPEVGESVREALLSQWYRRDGDFVRKGEILFLIETDKVTLEVVAEADGVLKIMVAEGATVPVGTVVATLEAETAPAGISAPPSPAAKEALPAAVGREREPPQPVAAEEAGGSAGFDGGKGRPEPAPHGPNVAPAAQRLAEEKGIDVAKVPGTGPGGRITKGDVLIYLEQSLSSAAEKPLETAAISSSGTNS